MLLKNIFENSKDFKCIRIGLQIMHFIESNKLDSQKLNNYFLGGQQAVLWNLHLILTVHPTLQENDV